MEFEAGDQILNVTGLPITLSYSGESIFSFKIPENVTASFAGIAFTIDTEKAS